jgi:hypothetical protein
MDAGVGSARELACRVGSRRHCQVFDEMPAAGLVACAHWREGEQQLVSERDTHTILLQSPAVFGTEGDAWGGWRGRGRRGVLAAHWGSAERVGEVELVCMSGRDVELEGAIEGDRTRVKELQKREGKMLAPCGSPREGSDG